MCCEDIKIQYSKHSVGRLVALTGASQLLVSPDPYRWSIVVGQVASGNAWIIADQVAVVGNGFQLATVQAPLVLTRDEVGDTVSKAFYIIHSAGGVNIWVVETFLLPGGVCGNFYEHSNGSIKQRSASGQSAGAA